MSNSIGKSAQIIGLGELLWDCFPDRRRPGGAPANVAYHAQQLGLRSAVATRVGADELGNEICDFLVSHGLSIQLVQIDAHRQTGTVTISPVSTAEVNYLFLENSAWDFLDLTPELIDAVSAAEAICFGTLAQRRPMARRTIQNCLQRVSQGCLIVYDINLRAPFFVKDWIEKSFEQATIVKMNDDEVKVISDLLKVYSSSEEEFSKTLLDRYKRLELVCVTRGEHGCLGVTCDETIELPGNRIKVVDTVGAGDAFTAAIIFGCLNKWPLQKTLDLANRFGSMVASRPGAMPSLREELTALRSDLEWAYRTTPPV